MDIEAERELFEASLPGWNFRRYGGSHPTKAGDYFSVYTAAAWKGWQAGLPSGNGGGCRFFVSDGRPETMSAEEFERLEFKPVGGKP